jgi:hypothetical protein
VELYNRREGAQSGTNRGSHYIPEAAAQANTEEPAAAYEGSVTTRSPEGEKQGISSHSAGEEQASQQAVLGERPDAQASVNHSR